MVLTNDQRIKILKIFIGLILSLVGGFWTYTTYTANERKHELETLIGLGDSIAGMHVTCEKEFGGLADLANQSKGSKKGKCYAYFEDSHRKSLSAMITVRKPVFEPHGKWAKDWNVLQDQIARAGSENYKFNDIENAWVDILTTKGLREK